MFLLFCCIGHSATRPFILLSVEIMRPVQDGFLFILSARSPLPSLCVLFLRVSVVKLNVGHNFKFNEAYSLACGQDRDKKKKGMEDYNPILALIFYEALLADP